MCVRVWVCMRYYSGGDQKTTFGSLFSHLMEVKLRFSGLVEGIYLLNHLSGPLYVYLFIYLTQNTYATLVRLELTMQTRLDLISQRSLCLCLSSAGVRGVHHHA